MAAEEDDSKMSVKSLGGEKRSCGSTLPSGRAELAGPSFGCLPSENPCNPPLRIPLRSQELTIRCGAEIFSASGVEFRPLM